ncbi:uncharacterized protein LOC105425153 [Pogonomyrmex barbatus]|uniref:Uncharacterized protein LOC105425153 n=1 Tax=Pogonomyrmex barbatus TaxID=144034 RepID=A0A6I9W652_9HYME|nr:uncharacterized protein LOC105425153 [Pogonomyrmex barbatus]
MEYFIDQEKYFYLILLHINITLYIGIVALLAIGSIFITYLQHTCGMFKIASYRIKHAMKIDFLQNINLKNKILIIKGIICAVIIHREAMKLSKQLLSVFEIMFFCLIVDGVTCLSLNLFQVNFLFSNSIYIIIYQNCSEIAYIYNIAQNIVRIGKSKMSAL